MAKKRYYNYNNSNSSGNGNIFALAFLAVGAYVLYDSMSQPSVLPPRPNMQPVALPNGQSGWVNTAGVILNSAGQLLGIIDQLTGLFKPKDKMTTSETDTVLKSLGSKPGSNLDDLGGKAGVAGTIDAPWYDFEAGDKTLVL